MSGDIKTKSPVTAAAVTAIAAAVEPVNTTVKPVREKKDDYEQSRSYHFWRLLGVFFTWITKLLPMLPSPFTLVQNGHRGLKFRNGKLVDVLHTGRHYRNPCTESIWQYDTELARVQTVETSSNRSIDGVDLNVATKVVWDIRDLWAFYIKFANETGYTLIGSEDEGTARKLLEGFVLEAIRRVISTNTADTFNACGLKMVDALKDTVQLRVSDYGIRVKEFVIQDIDRVDKKDNGILNQAQIDRKNLNALSEAKTRAEVAAIETASLKAKLDTLGLEVFHATLRAQYMGRLAASTNAKTVVVGGGEVGPVAVHV